MTFDAITNRNEFFSNHYLDAVIDGDLNGLRQRWQEREDRGETTARSGLRGLPSAFFAARAAVSEAGRLHRPAALGHLNDLVLNALGFAPSRVEWELKRNTDSLVSVPVAAAVETSGGLLLLAIEAGMVDSVDDFGDFDEARVQDADPQPSRLLAPLLREADKTAVWSAFEAVGELFATDEPPRYVLVLGGRVVVLAERAKWADGRYLAVDLDAALERNDVRRAGELETIASLFSNDAINPEAETDGQGGGQGGSGQSVLDELVDKSHKHAVGVSKDLRHGIRDSIELLANEVIELLYEQTQAQHRTRFRGDQVDARQLSAECLRYLYRLLVLLYAESRPELGILPVDDEAYLAGYSVDRLRELCLVELTTDEARNGSHIHESLNLLFELVNDGYHAESAEQQLLFDAQAGGGSALTDLPMRSVEEYLQFPGLDAQLFDPASTELINRVTLRNETLQRVLRNLMLAKGKTRRDSAGFISYAQLGINQLGAVYEGLMAYTGFFASTDLYEVAKGGDPEDGTWMLPVDRADDFDDDVFVTRVDEITGQPERVLHPANTFVFRLSGRDRQRSASYYTPEVLTRCVVRHALAELLGLDDYAEPNGSSGITSAAELLDLTICEPALGSGAFANEAINQLSAEYLRRRQAELDETLDPDRYARELQKVKAHFALHQTYGVDLNATAVELAEVSLWLNAMYPGLKAPWFGLQLRHGNSLIGCRHATWRADQLADRPWAETRKSSLQPPVDRPLSQPGQPGTEPGGGPLADDEIHHFLLPGHGWAAVADRKEAKELRPDEVEALKKWRKGVLAAPGKAHAKRLAALAAGVEALWQAAAERIRLTQRGLHRDIEIYGLDRSTAGRDAGGNGPAAPVSRRQAREILSDPNSPLGRLRTAMDAWTGLWFWPLDSGQRPPSWDEWLAVVEELVRPDERHGLAGQLDLFDDLAGLLEAERDRQQGMVTVDQIAAAHPWLSVAVEAARSEGAWHWQLEFAPVFQAGGFDLQVGNPPWVRPRWLEDLVLAEHDPWWGVVDKPSAKVIKDRRAINLSEPNAQADYLAELASAEGTVEVLGSPVLRPLLTGIQTNLYMVFMDTVWRHSRESATVGLIHQEAHLVDPNAGALRSAAYKRLRLRAQFVNELKLFEDVKNNKPFSISIYGAERVSILFRQLCWLFHPQTLNESLATADDLPVGIKTRDGEWDQRASRLRVTVVDDGVLGAWGRLFDELGTRSNEVRALRPVLESDSQVVRTISAAVDRLSDVEYHWSDGLHEKGSKDDGTIIGDPDFVAHRPEEMILMGVHLSVANPYFSDPNSNRRSNRDNTEHDLESMKGQPSRRSVYRFLQPNVDRSNEGSNWRGTVETRWWRNIHRAMSDPSTERTVMGAIFPPGPSHIHSCMSYGFRDPASLVLFSSLLASLPIDWVFKLSGTTSVTDNQLRRLPFNTDSSLLPIAALRTLRLNCLTPDYAPLWDELYEPAWQHDAWTDPALTRSSLGAVDKTWSMDTPLRRDQDRWQALVELDALAALMLGLTAEQLCAMYRTQFAVLRKYEYKMVFDAEGRKICGYHQSAGYRQAQLQDQAKAGDLPKDWSNLWILYEQYEAEPGSVGWGDHYTAPFTRVDREVAMTRAYETFATRHPEPT